MATELRSGSVTEFRNEPLVDFNDPENVGRMQAALATVRSEMGRTYPLIIGARAITEGGLADSVNPADPTQVIGRFVQASVEHARQAIEAADEAFATWSRRTWEERADVLFRTAARCASSASSWPRCWCTR